MGELAETNRIEVARLVQDGKLYYETGRLDAALMNLQAALRLEPTNQAAAHYRDLVQSRLHKEEARALLPEREQDWLAPVVGNQGRTNEAPPANTNAMHTRIFHIDPNTFQEGLDKIQALRTTNPPPRDASRIVQLGKTNSLRTGVVPVETVIPHVREFFTALGVDMTLPDKAIFYKNRVASHFAKC